MEYNSEVCIKAVLEAKEPDGEYIKYTFANSNLRNDHPKKYMTCVRCPNWHGKDIYEGQEGFVTFKSVRGGVDEYYDKQTDSFKKYLSGAIYFQSFVPITYVLKDGFVINKNKLKIS